MIDVKSVAKPRPSDSGLEGAVIEEAKVLDGSSGQDSSEKSRSVNLLIKQGKGDAIIRSTPGGLESIIGIDERTRILDTDLAPWRMICALRMRSGTGATAIGTGWLAGPSTLITAGHCVFSQHFFGGWADSIEIIPGRNGQEIPFQNLTRTVRHGFEATDKWVDTQDPDFDIGVIHLPESIGEVLGWFSVAALPANDLNTAFVNISGYPADRGAGKEQYFHSNRINRVTERRVFYDVDTFGGQSGAPVWIHRSQGDAPTVVGIHAYGTGGTPASFNITANSAPRIIPEVLQLIEKWRANGPGV